MKVQFIAPFLDGTGYCRAAEEAALALSIYDDVYCKPVKLNQLEYQTKVKHLIEKKSDDYDVVIQMLTPNFFYFQRPSTIGWWFQEGENQGKAAGWHRHISLINEWVCGPFTGVSRGAASMLVPTSTDYSKEYEGILPKKERFRFYYIGDFNRRKNLEGLIKAFTLAFQKKEHVELILKINGDPRLVQDLVRKIQEDSKLNPMRLPAITLNYGFFTEERILGLHQECDCFVTMSRAEGWCLPAVDANCFGKLVLLPDYMENIGNEHCLPFRDCVLTPTKETNCWHADSMPGLYNANEKWNEPSVLSMSQNMLWAYGQSTKRPINHHLIRELSPNIVGKQIQERIVAAHNQRTY